MYNTFNSADWLSRAPRGARGLKLYNFERPAEYNMSCPSRGTWIEISGVNEFGEFISGRAPRGARGLKCRWEVRYDKNKRVVPLAGHVD